MKIKKLSLVVILAIQGVLFADSAIASKTPTDFTYSANMALTSNYLWRGLTQTNDHAAIQGGIDLGYRGFYTGVSASNVELAGYETIMEIDLYGGYKGEIANIGYDIGYITYNYPKSATALNFQEAYFGLSKNIDNLGLSAKYYLSTKAQDTYNKLNYYELAAIYTLPYEFSLGATYGDYEDTGKNYSAKLSKSLGNFTASIAYINFHANGISGLSDDENVVGTVSVSF